MTAHRGDPFVRPVCEADEKAVLRVLSASELFSSDELPGLMDVIKGHFAVTGHANEEDGGVLVVEAAGGIAAVAYYAPERMTQGTWNLYMLVVDPEQRRHRFGTMLIDAVERTLLRRAHLLLVETIDLPAFLAARSLYLRSGFTLEARVRDFYKPGEDKLIFRKLVGRPPE